MFESTLEPNRRPMGPSDQELVPALTTAFRLDPHLIGEVTLEREVLRDLPGNRIVERITLRRAAVTVATAVAKTQVDGCSDRLFRALSPLDLPIARLMAYLPEHRLLLMEDVQGERLDHQLFAGGGEATALRAGGAIATIHRYEPEWLEPITLEDLVMSLRPAPAHLPGSLGEQGAILADALLHRCTDPIGRRAVLCHRDLHPRQIIDDGKQALIIDLAGLGHPALDLANFEVYLRVRHPDRAPSVLSAFTAGYIAAGGRRDDPEAEGIYRAFTYLRLAVKTYRTAPAGWSELTATLLGHGIAELGLSGRDRQQASP